MGKYNEELVKAGVMLAGEGLQPSSKGARVQFSGTQAHGDRRPVRRDQGADRRLLDVAGEVDGRGDRVGQALPEPHAGDSEIEIRQMFEVEDFGDSVTPSITGSEQEDRASGNSRSRCPGRLGVGTYHPCRDDVIDRRDRRP